MDSQKMYDVIVVGSGPAGCAAAIYTSRAGLRTLVIAGLTPGGQLMKTTFVENFPGFPDGVMGPELMMNMMRQAEKYGAEIANEEAVEADFSSRPFRIFTDKGTYEGLSVIVATGASPKWLGIESEQRLIGRGVSSCAPCDAPLFRGAKNLVVVGGGDSAAEYALFCANIAQQVTLIHRRDKLRASKIMQDRLFSEPKIKILWNTIIEEIIGEERVEGVMVRDLVSGERKRIDCEAVFVAIGHKPETEIFRGWLEVDDEGYIVTRDFVKTNIEGVFAAGEVMDKRYRQAISSAGFGCMAALEAIRYIEIIRAKMGGR
ncbi:MAG: thioredoxin-disulfide reductase [Nitrososphaeria archaeon]|nr:thioredoxin-disulfide reductase [Aigarchaeota archaeon]MCX8187065.1 thioredoxin-disulfide reductase [Nitrososphaeria archaeon]